MRYDKGEWGSSVLVLFILFFPFIILGAQCLGLIDKPKDYDYNLTITDENIKINGIDRISIQDNGGMFGSPTATKITYTLNDGTGGSITTSSNFHVEKYIDDKT